MAKTRSSRRAGVPAAALIVAGILYLLELLLSHIGVSAVGPILLFLAYAALTVAFVAMFLWRSVELVLRLAFIVGAIGWALLAFAAVSDVGNGLSVLAEILALLGTLVAGIIVFTRHIFSRRANLAFLVLAIVAAIYLLVGLSALGAGASLALVLAIVFGLMLVVAGYFMRARR